MGKLKVGVSTTMQVSIHFGGRCLPLERPLVNQCPPLPPARCRPRRQSVRSASALAAATTAATAAAARRGTGGRRRRSTRRRSAPGEGLAPARPAGLRTAPTSLCTRKGPALSKACWFAHSSVAYASRSAPKKGPFCCAARMPCHALDRRWQGGTSPESTATAEGGGRMWQEA